MNQRGEVALPSEAMRVVEQLIAHYDDRPELAWMYGQGSVFTRLCDDSDLDLILVWDQPPAAATLPERFGVRLIHHDALVLEKSTIDAYDVDLMHVPRKVFDGWIAQVERGEGWAGDPWPGPIHVAAGLAEGVMLVDGREEGAAEHLRVQHPSSVLVRVVTDQLRSSVPGYLDELRRSAERGHRWLFASLSSQVHKLIYLTWFLVEGHYPPFPKYLPLWFARLKMDTEIRELEEDYWSAAADPERAEAMAELATAVVELAEQALDLGP